MRVRLDSIREPRAQAAPEASRAREVEPRRTPLGPGEIRKALAAGYQRIHGRSIEPKLLDVLSAQVCHETGWGASMHNFNFGGIKGSSPEGLTAKCRTKEVLDGREVSIRDGFRAYSSATEGATDYLAFLERKHPRALEAAAKGDVSGYVRSLKAGHYFTADESQYAASLHGILQRGFDGGQVSPSAPQRAAPIELGPIGLGPDLGVASLDAYPTSVTVSRVMDALSMSASSIAAPPSEES